MDDYIDSLPKYVHRPLDGPKWIRIVQLLPSDIVQAVLRCCILHLDRDTLAISIDPSSNYYSAVSYVWGAPDFSRNFMCCDDSGQGQDSKKLDRDYIKCGNHASTYPKTKQITQSLGWCYLLGSIKPSGTITTGTLNGRDLPSVISDIYLDGKVRSRCR